ncbi:MAG: cyclic nucleotide-binding domain-containing protein [Elusimicrobia bacterium]|nr:cyclic nucleotide-binding domain-containing protein [Elusimicrobiota bacterium]
MELEKPLLAFWYGSLSAVSLPLGALLGLWLKPSSKWTSSLMAFGAGALLAALTLELVAGGLKLAGFWPLGGGCVLGAALFMLLDRLLNSKGGFLRKRSTAAKHLSARKLARYSDMLKRLSGIGLFRSLPPEEISAVVEFARPFSARGGEVIFNEGDPGDRLYIIESGAAAVTSGRNTRKVAELGAGEAFGEMALISGDPRSARVSALKDVSGWTIGKDDFDRLLGQSPRLKQEISRLYVKHLDGLFGSEGSGAEAAKWEKLARARINVSSLAPSESELKAESQKHSGAAFAIWLGILLDGIPESLVIGASMLHSSAVSMTLIAGVFLANFPEALSSSVGMSKQGSGRSKIIWMWTSLMLMTGIGAFLGYLTFGGLSHGLFVFIEGMAAGAMLAMIAETMLPEATEQGGPAVGMMTVLGFLAAIFINSLSH